MNLAALTACGSASGALGFSSERACLLQMFNSIVIRVVRNGTINKPKEVL
jgi:hypothetical protein